MRQLTYELSDGFTQQDLQRQVADLPEYKRASGRLVLVFEPNSDRDHAQRCIDKAKIGFPGATVLGITTLSSNNPEVCTPTHPVCTILLFEHADVHVDIYDCHDMDPIDAAYDFAEELFRYEHVKGVLCVSSCARMCPTPFIEYIALAFPDVSLFGTQAGTKDLTNDQSFFFVDDVIYDRGITAITFCGEDLHISCDYNLGWRPIGKELVVTGYDGNGFVSTIDDKPASSIYRKYLGVLPDEHFFTNVCAFPLMSQCGHRMIARVPMSSTLDGMLQFSMTIEKGERMRFSYTKPDYLMRGSLSSANAIAQASPEGLILFTCLNRRIFLGNEKADRELSYYRNACPDMIWGYGYGEILRSSEGGSIMNSSIVAVAFREGSAAESPAVEIDDPALLERDSYIPLTERLATFLEATTSELNDTIDELETLAERDQLTGIYNRRRMDELIRYELSKRRTNDELVLLMYDIDFFKRVNDTYGHDTGDIVLKDLTQCVHGVIRAADTLGRWGGEEFLCLLTNTTLSQARMVAERIRRRVEQTSFPHVGQVTISIGITAAEANDTSESLFNRVDKALYDAKHAGRNCVAVR